MDFRGCPPMLHETTEFPASGRAGRVTAASELAAVDIVGTGDGVARRRQIRKQRIEGDAGLPQKPELRRFMWLDRTVGEDVAQSRAALVEVPRYQQEAVAIERLAFGAHERDAIAHGPIQHAVEPGPERRRR